MLFFSAVNPAALELLNEIQDITILKDFYLVGGTALTLKYGHRISVDLDFFTLSEFDTNNLVDSLKESFPINVVSQAMNSLTIDIRSVKTDFIRHNYPMLNHILKVEGIRMASPEDIAAMKLNGIMNRGSKKDFYDIHELLGHFSLKEILSFHSSKYNYSSQLAQLKSLTYFEDAEHEPDPISIKEIKWNLVKQKISEAVRLFPEK